MLDKWEGLRLLTDAAQYFDLSHRSLGVLRALLSFLPARLIRPDEAIVYPSNRTLSERMNGMPESTLRRHLAALVGAGIVNRRDSPNRKRFSRRAGQGAIAFGFDLAPLARMATALQIRADEAAAHREKIALLRVQLADLRGQAIDYTGDTALTDDARRALRNKPDSAVLKALVTTLKSVLPRTITPEMSASDSHNERHIDIETIIVPDSEKPAQMEASEPDFQRVTKSCREYRTYFPEPVRTWRDLVHVADTLSPMMGIDPPVFHEAMRVMGAKTAAVTVLCMLDGLAAITNPGGYLRRLTQRAKAGVFTADGLLSALERRKIVS